MDPCICRVEPQVKSAFAVPDRLQGDDIDEMRVLVFADGFEDRFWFINLPEQVFLNGQKHHYQIGMNWQSNDDGWSYDSCPIRNLLGCWDQSGSKVRLKAGSENDRTVVGYQAAAIRNDPTGIHYEVRVKNGSDVPWQDVYTWICFNSFQSPATGYRPYVKRDRWIPFQDVPYVRGHCYLPVNGMTAEYARTALSRDRLAGTSVSFPGVVAWNIVKGEPLLTCHYSTDAVAVSSNQGWPCTDVFLWFGLIQPEQEVCRTGHVFIAKSDLESFSGEAEKLLQK